MTEGTWRVVFAGLLALAAGGTVGAGELAVTDGGWALEGPSIAVGKADGRDVIAVENGLAYRRDVRLGDGTGCAPSTSASATRPPSSSTESRSSAARRPTAPATTSCSS